MEHGITFILKGGSLEFTIIFVFIFGILENNDTFDFVFDNNNLGHPES